MAAVSYLFWIPVLRKLSKSVIQNCYGCKRFRATHCPNPKPELSLRDAYYKSKDKMDLKTYILIFSRSVSRAVHLHISFVSLNKFSPILVVGNFVLSACKRNRFSYLFSGIFKIYYKNNVISNNKIHPHKRQKHNVFAKQFSFLFLF